MASLNDGGRFIEVVNFPALNKQGQGSDLTIAQAIVAAARSGAKVISLSLGGYSPHPSPIQVKAINYAKRKGAIVIAAAGNSSEDAKNYSPANVPGVIVVGATDRANQIAKFSNTNTGLNMPIAAPGVDILSLKTGGDYISYSGTSMATPLVAGLAAVMVSLNPRLSPDQVYSILYTTGTDGPNADKVGRTINAKKAIEQAIGQ
jgi:subtilisin family serine protease